jgi:hypothetical protein
MHELETNAATKYREKHMLKSSQRRFLGGLALAVGLVGLAAPSADATDLGDLFVSPTTGGSNDFITMVTHAPCPGGTINVKVSINGPGITDTTANNLNGVTLYSATTANDQGGFNLQAVTTLKDIFQAYAITDPSGVYNLNLRCQNSNGGTVYGDFLGAINLVDTATAFEGNYTFVPPTPDGVATTTALAPNPASPILAGATTDLTATVSQSAATGTVQFKDGATNLGAAVPTVSGVATKAAVALAAGSHNLTAVFTSSDQNAFLSSTSPVTTFVVAGPASVIGTKKVGSTITCSSASTPGATKAYVWYRGTTMSSITTSTLKLPASWYNYTVKCAVKTTHNAVTVTQTSPTSTTKVAAGTALKYTKRPYITGTLHVARTLTCNHGTWSPTATSYKYQWYRSGTVLSGRTASTYKTVTADKGRTMTCKVTALKTGYHSGVATSVGKKIT